MDQFLERPKLTRNFFEFEKAISTSEKGACLSVSKNLAQYLLHGGILINCGNCYNNIM